MVSLNSLLHVNRQCIDHNQYKPQPHIVPPHYLKLDSMV